MSNLPTSRYYPRLSEIVVIEDLPEFLSFVQDGLNSVFDDIHYKNLKFSRSVRGDGAFYSLDIIVTKEIRMPLPGDLAFVLNPDELGNPQLSSFPITVAYSWPILAYLRSFNLQGFSFSVKDFYLLGLQVFRLTEEMVLTHTINNFVVPVDANTTKLQQTVDDIADYVALRFPNSTPFALPAGTAPSVQAILQAIAARPEITEPMSLILFLMYIDEGDDASVKQRLDDFFNVMVPNGITEFIKDLIIPSAKASFLLKAAIEFPPNLLRPVNAEGVLQSGVSQFVFAEARLIIDTKEGIDYQLELGGSLNSAFAEIGKSGLLLQLDTLKVDLSKKKNIAEADADGRPSDFTGVYVKAVSVTLPKKWFHNSTDTNNTNTTLRIGGYDLLIGTGGLSGTFVLETVPYIGAAGIADYFHNDFTLNYPVTVYKKDSDNKVNEVKMASEAELVTFINSQGVSALSTTFKFPLSLVEAGSNQIKVFNSVTEYQKFLGKLDTAQNVFWQKIGGASGFSIGFEEFDITFKQDQVVESNLKGKLKIPSFKKQGTNDDFVADVKGHLGADGDFDLSATFEGGIVARLFDIVDLRFNYLSLGKTEDNDFYIGAAIELEFPTGLMNTITHGKKIVLPNIRIYSDGRFEIVGGNVSLPIAFSLPLGPVDLNVTAIHMGSIQRQIGNAQRKYNYFGFDGGISMEPFSIDARGEGVKFYYATDGSGDSYLHIDTIKIDMVVPNDEPAVTIHGMLTIPEPGVSQEYSGEVAFKSSQSELAGNAQMRLMPKYPAFIIDASVTLPKPIPLGSLSIYGFRGLIGHRYVAEKKAAGLPNTATWYEYLQTPPKGISIKKFSSPEQTTSYSNPFSFGAGIVIGTTADNGFTFSMRAMLLLSLPSLFVVEGKATILESRPGLTDSSEPPFYASLAWSSTSIELGAGVKYKQPKSSGNIIDVSAEMRAAFFKNHPSNWYINIGTKAAPNMATLFKELIAIRAMSYVMMNARGIELGAGVKFQIKKKFIFTVTIKVSVEVGASISFERPQIGGYLKFDGSISFKFSGFSFKPSVKAYLAAEAVEPACIEAKLQFRFHIHLGFFSVTLKPSIHIKWETNRHVNKTPIAPLPFSLGTASTNRALDFVKGTHMVTNESFELNFLGTGDTFDDTKIVNFIPIDTYIDIKAIKGLIPGAITKIGGYTSGADSFTDLIPPKKTVGGNKTLRQVKHKYAITNFNVKIKGDNGQWKDYHPYIALTDQAHQPQVAAFKYGYWQRSGNQYNAIRVLANNPLSYLDSGEPGWTIPEQMGMTAADLYCYSETTVTHISNVLQKQPGLIYLISPVYTPPFIGGVYYELGRVFDFDTPITDAIDLTEIFVTQIPNSHNFAKSLTFNSVNTLVINFEEDVYNTTLKISSNYPNIRLHYLKSVVAGSEEGEALFLEVNSIDVNTSDMEGDITYENTETGYIRIVIEPLLPQSNEIDNLLQQIDGLYTIEEENGAIISYAISAENLALYNGMQLQLQQLLTEAMTASLVQQCGIGDSILCDFYQSLNANYAFPSLPNANSFNEQAYMDFVAAMKIFFSDNDAYDPTFHHFILEMETAVYNFQIASGSAALDQLMYLYNIMKDVADSFMQTLLLEGNCNCESPVYNYTSLQQVEYKTLTEYEFTQTIPEQAAVQEDLQLMQQAISRNPQATWRPFSSYVIQLTMTDTVDTLSPHEYKYTFGFKTAGPIGHFHNYPGGKYGNEYDKYGNLLNRKTEDGIIDPNANLSNPEKYALTSLKPYIDFKRSYPDFEGNIIMSKPAYFESGSFIMQLAFVKPSAYNMFQNWNAYTSAQLQALHGALDIIIMDPTGIGSINYPLPTNVTNIPVADTISWEPNADEHLSSVAFQYMQSLMTHGDFTCTLGPYGVIHPNNPIITTTFSNLDPGKLYTAIVRSAISHDSNPAHATANEVYRFVFQTSRYGNFETQINSFYTNSEKTAFRQHVLTGDYSSTDLSDLATVATTGLHPVLSTRYQDPFDCIFSGILKISPLDPAQGTEVNIIRNSDGSTIALFIRNPEPFNEPRIPLNTLKESVFIADLNDAVLNCQAVHCKDAAQLIIVPAIALPASFKIKFKYLKWNANTMSGGAYVDEYNNGATANYPFLIVTP